jgi:hypothetical protein
MAENKKLTAFLLRAGDALAINVGGALFTSVDSAMNKVPFFSSVVGIGTNPSQAKWRKSGLYTLAGLAVDAGIDFFVDEEDSEGLGLVARYSTDVIYGLSAGNIAGDPVINAYPPLYQTGRTATAASTNIAKSNITGAIG